MTSKQTSKQTSKHSDRGGAVSRHPMTTTLARIKAHGPCADGWHKLLTHLGKTKADDEPLLYATILASNGLDDALWACRAEPRYDREWRLYEGRCDAVRDAARDAAGAAARTAACNAGWAAAWEAAWDAAVAAQKAEFLRMVGGA